MINTVGELIDELAQHDNATPVLIWADGKARQIASVAKRNGQIMLRIEWGEDQDDPPTRRATYNGLPTGI